MNVFSLGLLIALSFPLVPAQAAEGDCYCVFDDETYTQYSGEDTIADAGDCRSACEDEADGLGKTLDRPEYDDGTGSGFDPNDEGLTEAEGSLSEEIESEAARRDEIETRAEAFAEAGLCQCYCGIKGEGSRPIQGKFKESGECKLMCEENGKIFTSCARSASVTPLSNPVCWNSSECKEQKGLWSVDQPTECEPSRHYCYPKPEAISLNIDIGAVTKISDIGTYINVFYTYGLGAATVIAIVLIMIGGAQYILGSGIGSVEAGKKRITNAVTGLVILLGAYLILATVNPYLVNWKTLEIPKLKPSAFLAGSSCNDYEDLGYSVDPTEVTSPPSIYCGYKGLVTSSPDGTEMVQECIYDRCSTSGEYCGNLNGTYDCLSCLQTEAAEKKGFKPSASSCSGFTIPTESTGTFNRCVFIPSSRFYEALGYKSGHCAYFPFECDAITSCADYQYLQYKTGNGDVWLWTSPFLNSLCSEDPCRVSDGPCTYQDGLYEDTVNRITARSGYIYYNYCESRAVVTK